MNKPETIGRYILWTQGVPPKDYQYYYATIRILKMSGYRYDTIKIYWSSLFNQWYDAEYEEETVLEQDIMCWTEDIHNTVPERFLK